MTGTVGDEEDRTARQASDERAREEGRWSEPESAHDRMVQQRLADILARREATALADQIEAGSSAWPQVDLPTVFAEGLELPTPSLLQREDGQGLLYADLANCLFGDAGHGKSAMAQWAVSEEIKAGRPVYVADWELNPRLWLVRLLALGCTPDQVMGCLRYFDVKQGSHPPRGQDGARLVVVDSLTAAIEAGGFEINDPRGIESVYRQVMDPFTDAGLGVLVLDHVGHQDKHRPMNSIRKTGIVQGAMLRVEVIPGLEFGRDRVGASLITLHKDNPGGLYAARGDVVGKFVMSSTEGGRNIECRLVPGDDFATAMQTLVGLGTLQQRKRVAVLDVLADRLPHSKSAIRQAVGGKAEDVNAALHELEAEGLVAFAKGRGRTETYTLVHTEEPS